MVAMSLGALIIAGCVQLLVRSQQAYRVNETVARLQETARHALTLLELDIRMAGYWGLSNRVERIDNIALPLEPLPAALMSAASGINACGRNWAIHLLEPIAATDGRYDLDCAAYNRRPQPGADVLIIRRLEAADATPPDTPRLRIVANSNQGHIVIASCTNTGNSACNRIEPPAPSIPGGVSHDLLVHAYYVSRDATGTAGQPSLRRKRLIGGSNGATIQDEEVIARVEDFQVQLGTAESQSPHGVVFRDPDLVTAGDPDRPIVAVRLWLLVRAETRENGYIDAEAREYPPGRGIAPTRDNFRRMLVSTTIQVRNTRM